MPANLTQQYMKAEANFKAAVTPEEKLECLQEMMREIPKHKGTEKMQADLKKKLSQLKQEVESGKGKKAFAYRIEKQGGGCVALIGPPNSGKSSLLNALTSATALTAEYPFTTREPQQAMMYYEDAPIELVDLPPLSREHLESWLLPLVRACDLIFIILDVSSDNLLDDLEMCFQMLEDGKIKPVPDKPAESDDPRYAYIPALVLLNKSDAPNAAENQAIFQEFYQQKLPVFICSIRSGQGPEPLRQAVFDTLRLLRVYAKAPGHEADRKPYLLKRGNDLLDFAAMVHQDFAEKLDYARVWGTAVFDGQRVDHSYILQDKDIVELHL